jgi:AraC-like DNA-binding protein
MALLAADLGFADQAHMTRTLKASVGVPPGAVRTLAAGPDPWPGSDQAARIIKLLD